MKRKFLIIPLIIIIIASMIVIVNDKQTIEGVGSDFEHYFYLTNGMDYTKTQQGQLRGLSEGYEKTVPKMFTTISKPFAYKQTTYFFFIMLLFGIIMPLIFVYITKEWIYILLFYSTNLFFWTMQTGAYTSIIVIQLALMLMLIKDWKYRIPIILIATMTHSLGFIITMLAWTIIEISPKLKEETNKLKTLFCFSLGRTIIPESATKSIAGEQTTKLAIAKTISIKDILFFIGKFLNPIMIILAYKGLKKEKEIQYIIMFTIMLIMGIYISTRFLYLGTFFLLPLTITGIKTIKSKKWKRITYIGLTIFIVWNTITWLGDLWLRIYGYCPI